MTPAEVQVVVSAGGERQLDFLELGIASVWHGVAFDRTKRLPKLGDVLPNRHKKSKRSTREQSTEEQVATLIAMFPKQPEAPRV